MRLALKELVRGKARSGLLALAVTPLVLLALVLASLPPALERSAAGAIIHTSADVLVLAAGARGDLPSSRLDPVLVDEVAAVPGVTSAAALVERTITARAGDGEPIAVSLWGFVPGGPGEPANLVEGRLPGPGEVVVDRAAAGSGLPPGAALERDLGGASLQVVGATDGSRFNGTPTAFTPMQDWQAILSPPRGGGDGQGQASSTGGPAPANAIAVTIDDPAAASSVAARITNEVPGVQALTRAAAVEVVVAAHGATPPAGPLAALVLLLVMLLVGGVSLLLARRRLGTYTVLRAIGVSPSSLAQVVVGQVVLLATAAALLATLVLAIAALIAPAVRPAVIQPGAVLAVLVAVAAGSGLAGLLVARHVIRLDPAAAVRLR